MESVASHNYENRDMETEKKLQHSRREFVRKAAYLAPAIITLSAMPSFASAGSGYRAPHPRRPLPPRVRQRVRHYLRQHPHIRLRRNRPQNLRHLRFYRRHD